MSGKSNSHLCLMLNIYKSFHQMVKYGWQRNHISQDLTMLEILISIKASKGPSIYDVHTEGGVESGSGGRMWTGGGVQPHVDVHTEN